MSKKDFISAFAIGEICALILVFLSRMLGLPEIVNRFVVFFPFVLPVLSMGGVFFVDLLGKKWISLFQMGKTFLVGILNTLIDLAILNVLMDVFSIASGWPYTIFKAFSFSCATINSYLWNKFWSFEEEGKAKAQEFGKFYTVTIGGLIIHIVVSSVVVNIVGPQFGLSDQIWGTIGGIAAAFFGFLWNFFGYKLIVFKK
jgi:putative flippase GtrA